MSRAVALFDFDGTLTRGDSLIAFLRMVRGMPRMAMDVIKISPYLAAYTLNIIRNDTAKEAMLRQSLGGFSMESLRRSGLRFARDVIPSLIRDDMLHRLREHQSKGHICVLVSASLDIYLKPWAESMGLDHCLATALAVSPEGIVTGKIYGANCHGQEKVRCIKKLFDEHGPPDYIYAYGDTPGDIPMLAMANEKYWVKDDIRPFRN